MEFFGINLDNENPKHKSIYLIAGIFQQINSQIESVLQGFNLSLAKFNVLMVVKHQGGEKGLSQVEICKKLLVTPANITKMIDRLEKDDLLERILQAKDRRSNIVKITDKGSRLLDEAWPKYEEKIAQITSLLEETKVTELNTVLEQWCKNLI